MTKVTTKVKGVFIDLSLPVASLFHFKQEMPDQKQWSRISRDFLSCNEAASCNISETFI